MATVFPSAIDVFVNPSPFDNQNTATVVHSDQHADANDAITAIETALAPIVGIPSVAGTLVMKDGKAYLNYNDGATPLHEIVPQIAGDGSFTFGIDQVGVAL